MILRGPREFKRKWMQLEEFPNVFTQLKKKARYASQFEQNVKARWNEKDMIT